tara:strand:+ start:160 stop:417 length:258 start_codon:yes stop_codon:yes gene_type:complete
MIKICKIIWLTLLLSSCGLSYTYQQNLALQRGELVKETKNKLYNFKTGKEYKDFNSIPVGIIYVIGKNKCIKLARDGYRYIETIN